MFRLVHISDIHLAPLPRPTLFELMSKRITGYVNWKINRAAVQRPEYLQALISHMIDQHPDHVSITGDLVNLATNAEIERAGQWLENLAVKLGGRHMLTTIAGNHDAYVPGSLNKALARWAPFVSDDTTPPTAKDFPLVHRRENISIISCNSAEATLPFQATGYFRSKQAERLKQVLHDERDQFRIVLIHHLPIENETKKYKRLIGAELFCHCIQQSGAELILHGHTHLNSLYWMEDHKMKVPVLGVPAAGQIPGADKPAGRYNLISIDGEQGRWSCLLQEYGSAETSRTAFFELLNERKLHG
ncbi:MAG: metallophosphatase [Hyphomicrobiales bacterium]|nr:MAG: metallophosphatase [Hyphomicrobiales bacterium]